MFRRILISGAPGAGKSTCLGLLKGRFACVDEPARRVLAAERRSGGTGTGEQDAARFVALMLEQALADLGAAPDGQVVLHDRGLPDILAYAAHYGLPQAEILNACSAHPYEREVLWFDPWEAIYTQDEERTLDFEGAAAFGDLLAEGYRTCGYTLVPVPRLPSEGRADWIAARVSAA